MKVKTVKELIDVLKTLDPDAILDFEIEEYEGAIESEFFRVFESNGQKRIVYEC